MDLLQTVRKSGSRGGVNFSWDEVKSSQHRENYLGHSLMAPVGRWQKNKDLGWYAKADDAELTVEERKAREEQARREELRKVKEAEEDAMLKAMGLPVPERAAVNPNLEPLGLSKEKQGQVNEALREALGDEGEAKERAGSTGVRSREERRRRSRSRERRLEEGDEERSSKRRRRSRSRSRDCDREHKHKHRHRHHHEERSRSRSRDRRLRRSRGRDQWRDDGLEQRRKSYDERSRSRERDRRRRHRSRSRSRSPYQSFRQRGER